MLSARLASVPLMTRSLAMGRLQSAPLKFAQLEKTIASRLMLHTTAARQDIDSAAKYIGAGAATVGVAGSGAGI